MWKAERDDRARPDAFPFPLPQQGRVQPLPVPEPLPAPEPLRRQAAVGESIVIKGEITAAEDLLVTGRVEGRISIEGHALTVGPRASIVADVQARVAIVGGALRGNVSATDKVEVRQGGSVEGDITTPRIAIADGGSVRGRIDMPPAAA